MTNITNKVFDDSWLGLGDIDNIILSGNPLFGRTKEDIENPDLHLLRIFRNPNYFASTVKLLMGIELHPYKLLYCKNYGFVHSLCL